MSEILYIESYCKIKDSKVTLNSITAFEEENKDVKSFLKSIYKELDMKYPKFFKMDTLSKLAFIGAEYLLKDYDAGNTNIGIVFSNNASSLDTDRKHQKSINDKENYFPSPAIFVYTLPNIGIGEISIKHQLKSENAFFVFENYNAHFHHAYEKSLIENKKCDRILAGWVNIDENCCEAFLYLVSGNGKIEHTEQNLVKLYNN